MSAWGDSELLVQLLDRQFEFLTRLHGTSKVLRLSRLFSFVETEPQIAGVLDDFRAEAGAQHREYEAQDARVRDQLREIWSKYREGIREHLPGLAHEGLHAYCPTDRFEPELEKYERVRTISEDGKDPLPIETLVQALQSWLEWPDGIRGRYGDPFDVELAEAGSALTRLAAQHAFHTGKFREHRRSHPWAAYERLKGMREATNPAPPEGNGPQAWADFSASKEGSERLLRADGVFRGRERTGMGQVDALYEAIDKAAEILHEEIRLRLGLARSRLALVQRYAARCEAFDSERLRRACEEDSGNAERLLTLDLARFLFDAGLPPIIDATIGGLRPDLVHVLPTSLFYVEAKQYADDHPRSSLRKAYSQVWGTWGRLRKTYPGHEAFLVVFRRAGPWVELPPVLHHQGLKLYSVVADISTQAGSREKHPVVRLTAEELRPEEMADD